jgi:hypothetical protein
MKNSFGFPAPARHVNKRIEAPPTAVRPPVRAKLTKGVLIIRSAGSNLNPWAREAQTRFAFTILGTSVEIRKRRAEMGLMI